MRILASWFSCKACKSFSEFCEATRAPSAEDQPRLVSTYQVVAAQEAPEVFAAGGEGGLVYLEDALATVDLEVGEDTAL